MKKILLILIMCLSLVGCKQKEEKFYFDDEYYKSNELINADSNKINELVKNEKSFGVILYTPGCTSCIKFESLMETFRQEKNMSFYNLSAEEMQKTIINDYVKYTPSLILFNKGEVVSYLDAASDEDLKYYESIENFTEWISKYVILEK